MTQMIWNHYITANLKQLLSSVFGMERWVSEGAWLVPPKAICQRRSWVREAWGWMMEDRLKGGRLEKVLKMRQEHMAQLGHPSQELSNVKNQGTRSKWGLLSNQESRWASGMRSGQILLRGNGTAHWGLFYRFDRPWVGKCAHLQRGVVKWASMALKRIPANGVGELGNFLNSKIRKRRQNRRVRGTYFWEGNHSSYPQVRGIRRFPESLFNLFPDCL